MRREERRGRTSGSFGEISNADLVDSAQRIGGEGKGVLTLNV